MADEPKNIHSTTESAMGPGDDVDVGKIDEVAKHSEDGHYLRSFTSRQIHVMSLGGQIGAGIFISSGKNLHDGGPASLLLAFATICTCVWCMLQTVSEMTIAFPVSGNFVDYADRFVDPALAFAAGFAMWLGWTAVVAAEATFFSVLVKYWAQDSVHDAVWYTIFLAVMFFIFVLPNKQAFAWFEYCTAVLKVVTLLIFLVTAFAIILGAGPDGRLHTGETWQNGLAFRNGFKGYANSVLLAILAVGDNSFTGFLAGESKTPRFSIAHAVLLIPIRVAVFYLLSMTFIGLIVPADHNQLLGGSGVAASPFVIAIKDAGIPGLPDLLNAVILFAVASISAESIFVASRIMRTMAHQRLIHPILAKVDRRGRPVVALALTGAAAILMTYINLSAGGIKVFNWLAQIATTGYFMVWVVVGITSFRFRAALKAQGDPLFQQTYAWSCSFWPFPPAWLLLCCSLFTGCSIYLALYPIGSDTPSAYSFFQYLFGLILILAMGTGYKVLYRTKMRDPAMADLQTGRRHLPTEEVLMLDAYYAQSRSRRAWEYLKLW